ncbi:hypothetical protein [Nitrosomonas eutropha]|uniref:Lipoprotein n=2 Tax=Nitrosomonas eutropha TaxID=916 RepID=A0ABX5M7G0_9PROT|nr:hypothetical protein [Nitrosomonas eutropha]ABI59872.1 conserved hypothetical protein [Nitrosomonas eutropha C91]PXV80126.1 hypothetical protein C8R14_11942 [Nitrosomonas eutropha]SCX29388.1 hypothetical protein SAMN05216379_1542 [Nitrosomonas eutropha]SEI93377.1 hypothetical protein SAMN05216318_11642 [Nitrosomonas eutropha]
MRIKLFLTAVLSLGVSCFAESGESQPQSLSVTNQAEPISTENRQPAQIKAKKKKTKSQPSQEIGLDKKSLMIDYCRKHTC